MTWTSQAEKRAKVAEEKASAAVTAIGIKAPKQKKTKLNNLDAEKFCPATYTGDRVDKKCFAEFLNEVETHMRVLAPGLVARPLLEWAAAFRDQTIEMGDVTPYELATCVFSIP